MAVTGAPTRTPRLPVWARSSSIELAASRRRFWRHSGLAVALGVLLLLAPQLGVTANSTREFALTALYVISVMGLNLVFGLAGQVTLGPAATFAVGAYAGGLLAENVGWNPITAIPAAIGIAIVVGLLIGAPALRVGGFYLAMVTAIAALAIPSIVDLYPANPPAGTGGEDGMAVPMLHIGSNTFTGNADYRLIIVVTLVCALLIANVARTSWGRWFECLKISPLGTDALGVSVYRAKVTAFALSAAFGGLAGALYAPYEGYISPLQFGFSLSTAFFVALVIGGLGSMWGPLLGCVIYYLGPYYLLPSSVNALWQQVIFGVLIIAVVMLLPNGVAAGLGDLWGFVLKRLGRRPAQPAFDPARELAAEPSDERTAEQHRALGERTATELPPLLARAGARTAGEPVLVTEGVSKRFGGIVALDGAGLTVRSSEITALIGPNGSGKTTLLNVCSGFLAPDAGRVWVAGQDVGKLSAYRRARAGMARTFQHPVIFVGLSGTENVMAGCREGRPPTLATMFGLPNSRRHERIAAERAEALLHALGAEHLITAQAAKTSLADARILDLARALALDPVVLVLDEPAAGLGLDEIAVLEALIRAAANAGIGVLLVEHDVAFVARIADHVVALDRGRVIADGAPAEVRSHPAVLESYFGDLEAEEPAPSASQPASPQNA